MHAAHGQIDVDGFAISERRENGQVHAGAIVADDDTAVHVFRRNVLIEFFGHQAIAHAEFDRKFFEIGEGVLFR